MILGECVYIITGWRCGGLAEPAAAAALTTETVEDEHDEGEVVLDGENFLIA